jgi:hypothetical protein
MRPLYDGRIEDLGPGDFLYAPAWVRGWASTRCGGGRRHGLKLPPYMPVLDLESRFRCRECDPAARWSSRSGGQIARRTLP